MSAVLITNDNQRFKVTQSDVKSSVFLTTMLGDLDPNVDDNSSCPEIPLANVNGVILTKVLQYCDHHRHDDEDEQRDGQRVGPRVIGEWDRNFVDVEQQALFDLILAANYLEVKGLLNAGCARVSELVKGMSPEEAERTFNIENPSA